MGRVENGNICEEIRSENCDKSEGKEKGRKDGPFPSYQGRLPGPLGEAQAENHPGPRQKGCNHPPPSLPEQDLFGKNGLNAKACKKSLQGQENHAEGKNPMHERPVVPNKPKTGQSRAKDDTTKMKKTINRHSLLPSAFSLQPPGFLAKLFSALCPLSSAFCLQPSSPSCFLPSAFIQKKSLTGLTGLT